MAPNSCQLSARNDAIVIRGVHDVATDTFAETRKLEGKLDALVNLFSARNDAIVIRGVHDVAIDTSAETRKLEGKIDVPLNLTTITAETRHLIEKMAPNSCQLSARNDVIVIRGVHDVATDTSAETRKLEGKLDAFVNLVTQLAANQKPASGARVWDIRSSNDYHSSVCPSSQQSAVDERLEVMLQTPIEHHISRDKAYDRADGSQLQQSGVDEHPDAYAANTYSRPPLQGVHDVATDTSAETRKLEDKLHALVSLVTQLAANQKPVSVARVCDIRYSNDHHTSVCPYSQQSGFSARNDVIVIRGVHDVAIDRSAETGKLEGKLHAHVNLVTQLAAYQKPASVARVCGIRSSNDHHISTTIAVEARHLIKEMGTSPSSSVQEMMPLSLEEFIMWLRIHLLSLSLLQESVASVLPMTTILVSVLLHSNLEWVRILRPMLQTPIADHHSSRDKALDGEDGSQLLALRNRSLPLLQEFAASVLPITTFLVSVLLWSNMEWMNILRLILQTPITEHHNSKDKALDREDGSELLADTSAETGNQEGKLDALVKLVTQIATNQKPSSVARVYSIGFSNDHHTSVCPSSQKSGVVEHPEAYAANAYNTSAEIRKLEGTLHASVDLVTQLAANQKPASIARVYGIHSSNDHHTNTSAETRNLEGKLDALVNLVTQLAANQKSASVARACGICSSNDHHTSVCPSLQQSGFSARNDAIVKKGVHDVATDTSTETRNLEGKLDAIVNLVTQLAANQKPASVARVCDIHYCNDHHTSVCPSSQQSGVDEHPEAYAANTYSRPPRSRDKALDREDGSQLLADTSTETRNQDGKLDALVNLVTQLAANQKLAFVARVCDIRSFNDHHTSVCPSSQQSGVDEHPESFAANTYSRLPQQQRQGT
ncbi:hypothetical protein Fmac_032888 [Flemingia macrophylla]|uniref:Uncharacterized protein n=1 Tax=Flemingia macrophylla TaxID=520843 RepID=A0ABD1L666_9FABA